MLSWHFQLSKTNGVSKKWLKVYFSNINDWIETWCKHKGPKIYFSLNSILVMDLITFTNALVTVIRAITNLLIFHGDLAISNYWSIIICWKSKSYISLFKQESFGVISHKRKLNIIRLRIWIGFAVGGGTWFSESKRSHKA